LLDSIADFSKPSTRLNVSSRLLSRRDFADTYPSDALVAELHGMRREGERVLEGKREERRDGIVTAASKPH
jgi:hypothetical protein